MMHLLRHPLALALLAVTVAGCAAQDDLRANCFDAPGTQTETQQGAAGVDGVAAAAPMMTRAARCDFVAVAAGRGAGG